MIPRGGVFDKIGNWFEQSLVMLQWLRLLNEDVEMVCWEPLGKPGDGIDFQIREADSGLIAVQCKTRSVGTWSPADLKDPLAHARKRLDAEAQIYRFVSNQQPIALDNASVDARQFSDPAKWLHADETNRSKYVRYLGFNPADPSQLKQAMRLFQRIEVHGLSQDALNERIWENAGSLAGSQREALLHRLFACSRPETLSREWTSIDLHEILRSHEISLTHSWEARSTVVWLERLNGEFLRQAKASLRGRREIPRREAEQLRQLQGLHGEIVLVHGQSGAGKSAVVAQALRLMRNDGVRLLPLRADLVSEPIVGDDPIARFRSQLGERGGWLILDQLDQAATVRAVCLQTIARMVQAATSSGISVIVGCRSVDAHQDTNLHQILYDVGSKPREILVGDYDEQVVVDLLRPLGIPVDDLGRDLLRLVRNPLAMSLFLDVVEAKGTRPVSGSIVDIVEAWCRAFTQTYGTNFVPLLDEIAERMEADRVLAVDRHFIAPAFSGLVDRLVHEGILIKDSSDRVRTFHQVIPDTWLALQWSKSSNLEDLLEHLGPRRSQGLRHARRARLIVQHLANRGATGAAILDGLVWHPDIRFVVRGSLLLGFADLAEVSTRVAALIKRWVQREDRRSIILNTVLRGQPAWFDVLDDWLDEAWSTSSEEQRSLLLDCCASVAHRRGDLVARHLARWQRESPGTMQKAHEAFWHDPSEDSDELFQLRLDYLTSSTEQDLPPDWPRLMSANSMRAAKLLTAFLKKSTLEELIGSGRPDWIDQLPVGDDIPDAVLQSGAAVFDEFARWWSALDVAEILLIRGSFGAPLAQIVDFLGRCLGRALSAGEKTWEDLVGGLPAPIRPIDGWLLLRAGSHLDPTAAPRAVFAAAARWLQSDPKWLHTSVGWPTEGGRFGLARAFLEKVAPQLDAADYGTLEQWLADYPDEWTVAEEQGRHVLMQRHGGLPPNSRGETAFLLLPALDPTRWSSATRAVHESLARKFHGFAAMFEAGSLVAGFIGSKVPDDIADRQSARQWVEGIAKAPMFDDRCVPIANGNVGDGSRDVLIRQMHDLAERAPRRYFAVGKEMARAAERVPASALVALLDALGRTEAPGPSSPDWQPLGDDEFAELAVDPVFLGCDECAENLARAIQRRATYDWPDAVIARLVAIAREKGRRFEPQNRGIDDPVLHHRLNDAACIALKALANIARDHEKRRGELLPVAETFLQHDDAGLQASAAVVAWSCRDYDMVRSTHAVLRVARDPFVAAQPDIHPILRFLAIDPAVGRAVNADARRLLIGLLDHQQPPCADWGGIGVMCLRAGDVLDDAGLIKLLATNVVARRSAAGVLVDWLSQRDAPDWLKGIAVNLANDSEEKVGDEILRLFAGLRNQQLLDDRGFVSAIVQSAAARRRPRYLIRACDRRGNLRYLSEVVLTLGRQAAGSLADAAGRLALPREAEQVAGLLIRLNQEAEQAGDVGLAERSLDVLDQLVDTEVIRSGRAWKLVVASVEG